MIRISRNNWSHSALNEVFKIIPVVETAESLKGHNLYSKHKTTVFQFGQKLPELTIMNLLFRSRMILV